MNGIPNNSTTAYAAAEGYGERFNGGCRGQQTGVWQANLNGGQALYSVNYYDDRYRMVQQKGINGNGEQTATYTHFSFTGQPLKIKRVQGANTEVLDYTYDHADRLLTTVYRLNNDPAVTLADNVYDEIGRLITDRRNGNANLNLTYNGNQLQAVSDNATNSVYGNGMEFKDGATAITEYEYDKNGNLTKDLNKNISRIEYNCLNLPSRVTFANGDSIRYEYAADGTKLRTVHTIGGTTTTTDYCGNAVYENGELKMLLNDAGYVSFP